MKGIFLCALVARWFVSRGYHLKGLERYIYYFSGLTAQWLVSGDYRVTEPLQRVYLGNLACIL